MSYTMAGDKLHVDFSIKVLTDFFPWTTCLLEVDQLRVYPAGRNLLKSWGPSEHYGLRV